jgi:hypothetical protein
VFTVITLKENERLVYAGNTALRAPDGTPLNSVPQYMIVPEDEADPAAVKGIRENERLVPIGIVCTNKKQAEERFAAIKAGRTPPPRESTKTLYIKEDAAKINPKTGLSQAEEKAIDPLIIEDFLAVFAAANLGGTYEKA